MYVEISRIIPQKCPLGHDSCYCCDYEDGIDGIEGTVECTVKIKDEEEENS